MQTNDPVKAGVTKGALELREYFKRLGLAEEVSQQQMEMRMEEKHRESLRHLNSLM